ncbi:hypothetical protein GALL_444610 [mine drainage metagenome]|uniref:Uncharacterized protein n=1 Tax=mine drainage metagenome TaxID=410659 RepID=A0A1J5QD41_9ZZZZ
MLGVESPSTDQAPTAPSVALLVVTTLVPSVIVTLTPPSGPSGPVICPDIRPAPATIAIFSGVAAASAPVISKRWVWNPGLDTVMR